jgi:hypothetical protein
MRSHFYVCLQISQAQYDAATRSCLFSAVLRCCNVMLHADKSTVDSLHLMHRSW